MSSLKLDIDTIEEWVIPNINNTKDSIKETRELGIALKRIIPRSFSYYYMFNDIITELNTMENQLTSIKSQLQSKVAIARRINEKSNSKINELYEKLADRTVNIDTPVKQQYKNKVNILKDNLKGFAVVAKTGAKSVSDFASAYAKNNAIKKSIKNYYDLKDSSLDDKKLFGKDTTLGINGERIEFDKITKNEENGTIMYWKDHEIVKYIDEKNGYVNIGDTYYYEDGTKMTQGVDPEDSSIKIRTYYSASGDFVKEESIGYGSKTVTTYNADGAKRVEFGKGYMQYDKDGKLIEEKTYDGNEIKKYTYDLDGIKKIYTNGILSSVEDNDKIMYYDKNGIVLQIVYTNGIVEKYSDGIIKSRKDENGITTNYYYTESGEKIAVLENGDKSEKIYYDINGNITKKEIGNLDIGMKVEIYENNEVVDQYQIKDNIIIGSNYKEYSCFGSEYNDKLKELNMENKYIPWIQGIDKLRENYDQNGNIANVVLTGSVTRNNMSVNLKSIYYPDGTYEYYENDKLVECIKNENSCLTFYSSKNSTDDKMRMYRQIDSEGNDIVYLTMINSDGTENTFPSNMKRPDGSTVVYYSNGNPYFETLSDGTEVWYEYDGAKRIVYPDGREETYNASGNLHWKNY